MVYAVKPGDGSAREQAASCQRVIGSMTILPKSTQLNATVLTSSTGGCYRCRWRKCKP
ncbi:hypothetical protein ACLB1T_22185 [Escherichia coli]